MNPAKLYEQNGVKHCGMFTYRNFYPRSAERLHFQEHEKRLVSSFIPVFNGA